jgi:hypothetical protein
VFSSDAGQVTVNLEVGALTPPSPPVTRDVTFVITTCGVSVDTRVVPVSFDGVGMATVVLGAVDVDAEWISVSEGHTLRRLAPLSFVSCSAIVNVDGVNELSPGDFHTVVVPQDNLVDITDFSILASNFNVPINPDLSTGADATGDGVQATADFTAIQVNFLTVGDAVDACSTGAVMLGDRRVGITRFDGRTVLNNRMVPRSAVAVDRLQIVGAERADLNGDGVVDAADIRAFAFDHNLPLLPTFDRLLQALESNKPRRTRR